MKEAQFSIDLLGEMTFSGYTDGRDWNGWACPYFPFEEAQKLSAAWQNAGWESSYDASEDAFQFAAADGQDEEMEVFFGEELGGKKLYPIGAGAWIWDSSE